jgi:hypothetical protein
MHKEGQPFRPEPPITICSERGFPIMLWENSHGFKLEVKISSSSKLDISCKLEDGTDIECIGKLNHASRIIRIDAVDSKYAWFWFQTSY